MNQQIPHTHFSVLLPDEQASVIASRCPSGSIFPPGHTLRRYPSPAKALEATTLCDRYARYAQVCLRRIHTLRFETNLIMEEEHESSL
jgi:hypothetical protein